MAHSSPRPTWWHTPGESGRSGPTSRTGPPNWRKTTGVGATSTAHATASTSSSAAAGTRSAARSRSKSTWLLPPSRVAVGRCRCRAGRSTTESPGRTTGWTLASRRRAASRRAIYRTASSGNPSLLWSPEAASWTCTRRRASTPPRRWQRAPSMAPPPRTRSRHPSPRPSPFRALMRRCRSSSCRRAGPRLPLSMAASTSTTTRPQRSSDRGPTFSLAQRRSPSAPSTRHCSSTAQKHVGRVARHHRNSSSRQQRESESHFVRLYPGREMTRDRQDGVCRRGIHALFLGATKLDLC
mmetsp:Transcript_15416/g.49261  ORF Transcript_15416/g.49261 Transcript_15416/m.49261 type:complete len:296 (+) Transcript_15416:244-1131(+)